VTSIAFNIGKINEDDNYRFEALADNPDLAAQQARAQSKQTELITTGIETINTKARSLGEAMALNLDATGLQQAILDTDDFTTLDLSAFPSPLQEQELANATLSKEEQLLLKLEERIRTVILLTQLDPNRPINSLEDIESLETAALEVEPWFNEKESLEMSQYYSEELQKAQNSGKTNELETNLLNAFIKALAVKDQQAKIQKLSPLLCIAMKLQRFDL